MTLRTIDTHRCEARHLAWVRRFLYARARAEGKTMTSLEVPPGQTPTNGGRPSDVRSGSDEVRSPVKLDHDVVTALLWQDGAMPEEIALQDVSEHLRQPGCLVSVDLVDVEDGSRDFLRQLAEEFAFDEHHLDEALAPETRPKATRHAEDMFLRVYATFLNESEPDSVDALSRVRTSQIGIFLLEGGIVTVRPDDRFDMDRVHDRWVHDRHLHALGSGALLYGLLDTLVEENFTTVQALDDEVDRLEGDLFGILRSGEKGSDRITREEFKQFHEDIFRLRRDLVDLRRAILPLREVIQTVDHDSLGGEADKKLDDLFDELRDRVLRQGEWTDSLRDMITAVFETNLSVQDARLNDVMKRLTGWAAIIAVPTLITGWFGQNVYYPGVNGGAGLWLSTVIILMLALPLAWAFKKHEWI